MNEAVLGNSKTRYSPSLQLSAMEIVENITAVSSLQNHFRTMQAKICLNILKNWIFLKKIEKSVFGNFGMKDAALCILSRKVSPALHFSPKTSCRPGPGLPSPSTEPVETLP